jgi:DNA polymerase III epsilon subunit-like protein
LSRFWALIEPGDVFVGHNILDFDLPFIRQRSWIRSTRPSRRIDLRRFYSGDVIDTMQLWSNGGATTYPALERLGEAFGCGRRSGSGLPVSDWWALGDKLAVAEYCQDNVRLAFNIFNRMMFQPIPDRYLLHDRTVHVLNKKPVRD